MPEKIQLLTEEVIGKIAAGEVVERPSAAIKELVENSLDAGATAVTVEIRDGGISYFRVTDNGGGIRPGDIRMAFERHATSKIRVTDDLTAIRTLGFRGEALASIAAVAHVTCTTRARGEENGLKVQNDGGTITAMEEAACPQGTTFVVRDLFYNTPVRLKFLKKPVTEAGFVSDLMMRLILSRPDVSFRYISQGKTLYHSAGDGKLESAVFSIYGNELVRSMRRVEGCEAGVVLKGYVGIGEAGRGNRGHESFFINGRYMRDNVLSAAVEAACRERVMIGKFPTCVLHLTMPYEQVDVNVHPNKLEVRFQNEQAVAAAVEHIVHDSIADRDALERPTPLLLTPDAPAARQVSVVKTAVPDTPLKPDQPLPERPAARAPIPERAPVVLPERTEQPVLRQPAVSLGAVPVPPPVYTVPVVPAASPTASPMAAVKTEQPSFLPEQPKPLRIIGVAFKTYILAEYEDQLLMIDQHAVHERLLFERMTAEYDRHEAGQELLIPQVVSVTRREQELIAEHRALLASVGLTVEDFGEREVSVRSVPMILGEAQTADFLHEALDQLGGERGVMTMEKRRASILQSACKHAVKGGDDLNEEDIRHLVEKMLADRVTPTCPHGRPLVVSLTRAELEKKFRRIQ